MESRGDLLDRIISIYYRSERVNNKSKTAKLLRTISEKGYQSPSVHSSIGEDAAAIVEPDDADKFILITTDSIDHRFIRNNPYAAGFSAVYVGIDDIMAAGGIPLASSVNIGFSDEDSGKVILSGIFDATNVFKIPIVRGHTEFDAPNDYLSISIIGSCNRNEYISIKDLNYCDKLALVWDPSGQKGKYNPQYWNTFYFVKDDGKGGQIIDNKVYSEEWTGRFYSKRKFIREGKRKNALTFCKDVANGGVLGTLYQIAEYSRKSIVVDLSKFEDEYLEFFRSSGKTPPYTVEEFLTAYLSSSFIVAHADDKRETIKNIAEECGMKWIDLGYVLNRYNCSEADVKETDDSVGMLFTYNQRAKFISI